MPTYEYQCGTCGNRFEKFQSFSDEPVKACPECGNQVKKVFSAAGIIFKGSGWYVNDSRKTESSAKSSPKDSTDAPKEGDSTTTSTTTTESDSTKPAASETKKSGSEAAAW